MRRAALAIDVETIRIDAERDDIGAKLPQSLGRDVIRRPIRAIDRDLEAIQA